MRSDEELVWAVMGGEKQAFEELVRRYEKSVRAVCVSILRDGHLCGDAAQEAFVNAYQKLGTLKDGKNFGPWLMQIARRSSLEMARRKPVFAELKDEAWADSSNLNHQLDEEKRILLEAVMKLCEGEREAIMLRYFGGHAIRDIAEITGRSAGTITKQLCRAQGKLKKILGKSFAEAGK